MTPGEIETIKCVLRTLSDRLRDGTTNLPQQTTYNIGDAARNIDQAVSALVSAQIRIERNL